jgi:hypothetical protein
MFKDLLTKPSSNTIKTNDDQAKTKSQIDIHLKYREILCPKTKYPLITNNCLNCKYKKEYLRKHDLGLSLSTIICTWSKTD